MVYTGVKLHRGQKRILDIIFSRPECKFFIIKTSRQFGKTVFSLQLLLYYAINNSGFTIGFFSPFIPQAKKVMKQLYNAIKSSNIIHKFNKTERIMEFINGSIIYFFGVDNYDIIRGYSFDIVICDEAAFYPDNVFDEVIRPTLLVKGKKCFIFSTPKGKNNWFYRYYIMEGEQYCSIEANYTENPFIKEEDILAAMNSLPEHIFRQEYLGEFLDSEYQVFANINKSSVIDSWGIKSKVNYAGLDLARKNDYSVLTIINSNGEVVYIWRERFKSWSYILDNVVKILREYNAFCYVDATGVGDAIFEQLKKSYRNVFPFVITSSGEFSKQNLVENLILSLQNGVIKIPSHRLYPELHNEFSVFQCNYSPKSRVVQYSAMEGFHDDIIISLALANISFLKRKKSSSITIKFI